MRILGKRVLVKIQEPQEQRGGIFIPKIAQRRPQEGTVMAVGDEVDTVHVGDRIIFGKFSYQDVEPLGGALVWAKDIEAVLE